MTAASAVGGAVVPPNANVRNGSTASFSITPNAGYYIQSVSGCGGSLSGNTYLTGPVNGNCSISASFQRHTYEVSTAIGPGGEVSPGILTVAHGDTVAFTFTPFEGHFLFGATGCGGSLTGETFTTAPVTAACTVVAAFDLQRFTITTDAGTGGAFSAQSIEVAYGETATLYVTPHEGYHVLNVSGCQGELSGDAYTIGPVTADCMISGSFALNSYEVTATAAAGGQISPAMAVVEHGATASFTVAVDEGFRVNEVTGCGGTLSESEYTTGPIGGPCEVQATFRLPAVSGTVFPVPGTAVDSDVNDPRAPYTPNGSRLQAQVVSNPVTIGGYVNRPGAGPGGRSFLSGDTIDYYRVGLLGGQVVSLHIASDDTSDDLDLFLLDLDGFVVDASTSGSARVESVAVPQDGDGEYFLAVRAWSGASNFLLIIDSLTPGLEPGIRLSDEFAPGELVVRLAEGADLRAGNTIAPFALARMGAARRFESTPRSMLLRLDELKVDGARVAAVDAATKAFRNLTEAEDALRFRNAVDAAKFETLVMMKALAADPSVADVWPNYVYRPHSGFAPNDPLYLQQWHYPQIQLPMAWTYVDGTGVIVAVIDTGVFLEHPDLEGRLVEGYDFVLGVPGGDDPGGNFHGTHVAGTVAAATGNDLGVAGVAFGAQVMPLRVCGVSGCSFYDVEQGLRFAAGLANDSGTVPEVPAQVINLSLGRDGGPALPNEQALFDDLRARNIVVVSSAGNGNTSIKGYPAAYENVLAVSALDFNRQRSYYSNYGSWIDVAAPGGDTRVDRDGDGFVDGVLSTIARLEGGELQPSYARYQGTSMAAPHVAGVVALMRSAVPGLTAQDVEHLLWNGAITDDLGPPGKDDTYGFGLINAAKAVTAALDAGGQPVILEPRMIATPSALSFEVTIERRSVLLLNVGGGELQYGTPFEDSGGWLSVESEESDGRLLLTLSADRTGLAEGVYTATVSIPSSANTVDIPVALRVVDVLPGNVGLQYVLLVDPDTLETLHMAIADPQSDGSQWFRIENVTPGAYRLFSGSDNDNDSSTCTPGESCGSYQGPDGDTLIEVADEDIDGLEVASGYGEVATTPEAHDAGGLWLYLDKPAADAR